jgi:hypothetical protein
MAVTSGSFPPATQTELLRLVRAKHDAAALRHGVRTRPFFGPGRAVKLSLCRPRALFIDSPGERIAGVFR